MNMAARVYCRLSNLRSAQASDYWAHHAPLHHIRHRLVDSLQYIF